MHRLYSILIICAVSIGLFGCQPPSGPQYPDITFSNLPPIELDVAEIVVKTPYQEPLEPPHVGEQFPVSPSHAARRWVEDRLRAVGTGGQAVVTILESSAVEKELERTEGLKGVFTKDQAQSYEVAIEIKIEAQASEGQRTGSAIMRATKKTSVSEDATMNDREETWYQLTKDVMNSFNDAMEQQIRRTMGSFVR
jgi:hypothetical protein